MVIISVITIGIIVPSVTEAANPIDTYNAERQSLVTEQNKVSQQIKNDQAKLNSLLTTNKTLTLDAQKIRAELDVLQSKFTAQRKQISTLNQQIKDYRKNNNALLKGSKNQKAEYSKGLAALQDKYKQLQTKAASLKNEITKINQKYTEIKNKLNRNRNDIAAARKSIASKRQALGKITSAIQALNNKISVEQAPVSNKNDSQTTSNNNGKVNEQPAATKKPYLVDSDTLTEDEKELARLINEYRESLGLKPLPISKSMTTVARTHVNDSIHYYNKNSVDGRGESCNLHSWSANGTWSPVCYTGDHEYAEGMWNKPKELTSYQGNGFEISAYASPKLSPAGTLGLWQGSPGHNNVIIGNGFWADLTVMGVGIHDGYAHVWFGVEADPAGYME